jgi:hypothetical protein
MQWFVQTNSFAAPFCSDTGTQYVEANTAAQALTRAAYTYTHPCGLFSAAAWPSADAMHKGEPAAAMWLSNHEIERRRLTAGLGAYTYRGIAPGEFEIDGERHSIKKPKQGRVLASNAP